MSPANHGAGPRGVDVRAVLHAVFCVLSTGCQWSALPEWSGPHFDRTRGATVRTEVEAY